MAHSLCKVYIHFVWTTKNAQRLLTSESRTKLHGHLLEQAHSNDIMVEALNVQPEHVHLLVNIGRSQTIEGIAKMLKGESSHWLNHNDVTSGKFSWQTGYGAFSVSYTHRNDVVGYIENQDEHHRRVSFAEEYRNLLRKYGFTGAETDESVSGL